MSRESAIWEVFSGIRKEREKEMRNEDQASDDRAMEKPVTEAERKAGFKAVVYLNSSLEDPGVAANLLKALLEEAGFDVAGLAVRRQGLRPRRGLQPRRGND